MFVADQNIICAGREPDHNDLSAIRSARAVILAQGCQPALYAMARKNCTRIFPNLDCRFDYPGKTGQAQLFQKEAIRHPQTRIFKKIQGLLAAGNGNGLPMKLPFVFKHNWGGEGAGVHFVDSNKRWQKLTFELDQKESGEEDGFVVQAFVPCGNRALRVVVIGEYFQAYWRVQPDTNRFGTNLAQGGIIDHESDPHLMVAGLAAVTSFCAKTKINLAGFDLLFESASGPDSNPEPYFLEINYFFGRRGLGGSECFYAIFEAETKKWLNKISLIENTA